MLLIGTPADIPIFSILTIIAIVIPISYIFLKEQITKLKKKHKTKTIDILEAPILSLKSDNWLKDAKSEHRIIKSYFNSYYESTLFFLINSNGEPVVIFSTKGEFYYLKYSHHSCISEENLEYVFQPTISFLINKDLDIGYKSFEKQYIQRLNSNIKGVLWYNIGFYKAINSDTHFAIIVHDKKHSSGIVYVGIPIEPIEIPGENK